MLLLLLTQCVLLLEVSLQLALLQIFQMRLPELVHLLDVLLGVLLYFFGKHLDHYVL